MRARPFVCIVNVFMQFRSSGDSWFLHSQWCCCPAAVEHSGDIPSFVHKVIERERERERGAQVRDVVFTRPPRVDREINAI